MKFKVDENLPGEISELFSAEGWDSCTVVEQDLGGAPDDRIAAVCAAEHRILVTFDVGFSDTRVYRPSERPGVILFRLKNRQEKPSVLAVAARVIGALREHELRNELWIVHENHIRIRTE